MKKIMEKINVAGNTLAVKGKILKEKTKKALSNQRGETSVGSAIAILVSIVLGALLLAGLYFLFENYIMPTITTKISEMFEYKG